MNIQFMKYYFNYDNELLYYYLFINLTKSHQDKKV